MKRVFKAFLTTAVVFLLFSNVCSAVVLPFHIFTQNGEYYDDPGINLFVELSDGVGKADFTFHNESSIESIIAQIYFDDGSLLGIDYIENGPGTLFYKGATPGDLPSGETLIPPFVADREFTIGADNPAPQNGVNQPPPSEWVKISFDLINGGTLEDVIGELETGELRVGMHVISFPDGYSNAAILVPEPTCLLLFGLGIPLILRRNKKKTSQ